MAVASVLSLFAWGVLLINTLMLGLFALVVVRYRRKTQAINRVRLIADRYRFWSPLARLLGRCIYPNLVS